MNAAIDRFILNLAAAVSRHPSRETVDLYRSRLERWPLSPEQWSRALSLIVSDLTQNHLPLLAEIYPYLIRAQQGSREELIPVWDTYQDDQGRSFARRTGRLRPVFASNAEIAQWKADACPPWQAAAIYADAYQKAKSEQLAKFPILTKRREVYGWSLPVLPKPKISDYDDSLNYEDL